MLKFPHYVIKIPFYIIKISEVLISYEITKPLFSLAFVVIQCSVFVVTRSLILKIKMGKRNALSLQEKKKLIQKYDALRKTNQREAASKLEISQPLLCKLLRNLQKNHGILIVGML